MTPALLAAIVVLPALGCDRQDAAFWKQKFVNEVNYHYQTQQIKNAQIAAREVELETLKQYIAVLTERINGLEGKSEAPPESAAVAEGKITAVAGEIDLVVLSVGKDAGVTVGREVWIYRGDEYVGRAAVDRAEAKWSAAQMRERKKDPRVGDDVRSRPR